jgi:hypothetical protein
MGTLIVLGEIEQLLLWGYKKMPYYILVSFYKIVCVA